MKKNDIKKFKLPSNPGVYFFLKGKEILYIGKATNLKDRVKSYFSKDLITTRGPSLLDMVTQSNSIKHQKTDSVLEALILESNLIKKYQPKYNTKEKDNKSFNYVLITDEEVPKVLVERGRTLASKNIPKSSVFGPFPNSQQLREAMKIIRRIFPYVDEQSSKKNNIEFYRQLGLVPNTTIFGRSEKSFFSSGPRTREDKGPDQLGKELFFLPALNNYKKNIKNIKLFFQGKKKSIIINLKKEMLILAKRKDFEKANEIKKKIFALNHINDIALIKEDITQENTFGKVLGRGGREPVPDHSQKYFPAPLRIEAYDIAHMGGKNMVGVMVVVEDGEPNKSEYRKFIIKSLINANDTGALAEVLERRFRHREWKLPSLIVVDGGLAQQNVAKKILKKCGVQIPVTSVVKDDKHKAKAIMGDAELIRKYKKQILLANSESHRFAITYHKERRGKAFIGDHL